MRCCECGSVVPDDSRFLSTNVDIGTGNTKFKYVVCERCCLLLLYHQRTKFDGTVSVGHLIESYVDNVYLNDDEGVVLVNHIKALFQGHTYKHQYPNDVICGECGRVIVKPETGHKLVQEGEYIVFEHTLCSNCMELAASFKRKSGEIATAGTLIDSYIQYIGKTRVYTSLVERLKRLHTTCETPMRDQG